MDIYTVTSVTYERRFSEDDNRNAKLTLKPESQPSEEVLYFDVPEKELNEKGISEGKKVCFDKDGKLLKYVRVVAAVIRSSEAGAGKIFATARGYGEFKGWWEFPGGKIEQGETPQQALEREIKEELTVRINVKDLIRTIEYDYPEFHLSMDCFWAEIESGRLELKEAEAARWLTMDELDEVKWLPADLKLIGFIKQT